MSWGSSKVLSASQWLPVHAIGIEVCFINVTVTGTAFVISVKVAGAVCCTDVTATGSGIVISVKVAGLVCLISVTVDGSVGGCDH